MKQFTFVTGNKNKAEHLSRLLGLPVKHQSADVDEIQSVELRVVVEHKARQAFELIQEPVLVEDVGLEFAALGPLPGTFIKFFVEYAGLEACCRLLDGFTDRSAIAKCGYGYYDGKSFEYFEGEIKGSITHSPDEGERGFGWDKIFIPEGYGGVPRSSLTQKDYDKSYLQVKPIKSVRSFLVES